ncbi:hypothetical protein [Salinibacter altiplanensis]|uniref:hypothetical protein n=1 Tax=Salinibacter altiplanensis TaxID=1803181 RepID=UPI000C9FB92C|nr:hypothetical protein [Salinibacter altiplanensis]
MKNQYFGDINDYYKYGLLRALLRPASMDLLVGWMLTPDEGSTDGRKTSYLDRPDRYRSLDPELFDFLSRAVQNDQRRGVSAIEETGLLPRASYFSRFIPDGRNERSGYFDALLSMGGDIIFFDPDNGLEIKSKDRGHKSSSKYLFFDEVQRTWSSGRSVLIYQHFPRVGHEAYTKSRLQDLRRITSGPWISSVRTSHVLFLLAAQPEHAPPLEAGIEEVRESWGREFKEVQVLQPVEL